MIKAGKDFVVENTPRTQANFYEKFQSESVK